MAELTELNSKVHANLKIVPNCAINVAATQHVIGVRVTEVAQCVSTFPVFLSKVAESGQWALSAISSLEVGKSLFVENDVWQGAYMPAGMQAYPLFLMRKGEGDDNNYAVGIDEQSSAFSNSEGEALFDDNGKATLMLENRTKQLEANLKNDYLTYQFAQRIEELDLAKSINVLVRYADGTVNTLQGLHTIDEDKVQALSADTVAELHKNGYLATIYGMLMSMHQLNNLIQRHNKQNDSNKIGQIKLQLPRDEFAQ